MNTFPMIRSCCSYLDSIVLRPKVTLDLSSYNRRNGSFSEQKSISLSTGFTLLRGMIMLAGVSAATYGAIRYLRCKNRKKLYREFKRGQKQNEKVTKS